MQLIAFIHHTFNMKAAFLCVGGADFLVFWVFFAPSFPSVQKHFPGQFCQEGWRAAVSTVQARGLPTGQVSAGFSGLPPRF